MAEVINVRYYVVEENDTDMFVLSEEFDTESDCAKNTENKVGEEISK